MQATPWKPGAFPYGPCKGCGEIHWYEPSMTCNAEWPCGYDGGSVIPERSEACHWWRQLLGQAEQLKGLEEPCR